MPVRVVLVDDDPAFREAAATLLSDRGFAVVAQASGAEEARAAVAEHAPDAMLLDVNLPDGDGIALARELCGHDQRLRVLLTSSDAQAVSPAQLGTCGAAGFIPKTRLALEDLMPYLRS